jgi:hypothetical protein
MVENEAWFYHIFCKNSVLVPAKTTTSYDTVENALTSYEWQCCKLFLFSLHKRWIHNECNWIIENYAFRMATLILVYNINIKSGEKDKASITHVSVNRVANRLDHQAGYQKVQQTYSGKLSSRMPEMDLQRQGKHCF